MLYCRKANFINATDLWKAEESFTKQKAKQMMGAGNPNIGAAIRQPASTFCSACSRWHRPGNVCPSITKAVPPTVRGARVFSTLHSKNLLQTKPEAQKLPEDDQKKLEATESVQDSSNMHMNALRTWQSKYGGC